MVYQRHRNFCLIYRWLDDKKYMIMKNDLKDQIEEKIDEIALYMEKSNSELPSLVEGRTGEILFWFYYAKYKDDNKYAEKGMELLLDLFEKIEKGFTYPAFAGGLAGIGWAINHLYKYEFIEADIDNVLKSIDEYLYPFMMESFKEGNYDYLHGALGLSLYYIDRLPNPDAKVAIEKTVEELNKLAIRFDNEIAWREKYKDKISYNLSMSHGIASIITILSFIVDKKISVEIASDLLNGAVNFLLGSMKNNIEPYYFPSRIVDGTYSTKGHRLSWCYNDLGIGMAVYLSGLKTNNTAWKNAGEEILLNTTKIKETNIARTKDASLCHGSAGNSHIYNRIFQYTQNDRFLESSEMWIKKTIEYARYNDGLAGYKVYSPESYKGMYNDFGFLEGISGIGLALISFVSDIVPDWDRILLLS